MPCRDPTSPFQLGGPRRFLSSVPPEGCGYPRASGCFGQLKSLVTMTSSQVGATILRRTFERRKVKALTRLPHALASRKPACGRHLQVLVGARYSPNSNLAWRQREPHRELLAERVPVECG